MWVEVYYSPHFFFEYSAKEARVERCVQHILEFTRVVILYEYFLCCIPTY